MLYIVNAYTFHFFFSFNIRVVSSAYAGMGKSSFILEKDHALKNMVKSSGSWKKRMLKSKHPNVTLITVPIHGTFVSIDEITEALLIFEEDFETRFPRIYHFDIAPTVS